MSCNHIYSEEDSKNSNRKANQSNPASDEQEDVEWDEIQAEALLEGAGLYCSGSSIISALSLWVHYFDENDFNEEPLSQVNPSSSSTPSVVFDRASTEDLLESAGNYCSGGPILAAALSVLARMSSGVQEDNPEEILARTIRANILKAITQSNDDSHFLRMLPPDAHVNILSFLHPKDVVTFTCVSRSCQAVVDVLDSSAALWKNLWLRDYGWLVYSWDAGRDALKRSHGRDSVKFSKDFYFRFSQAYMNYILAGQNTFDRCLVGLHGNIYDLTRFLNDHPGSPDTVMVHAGRDATSFFEDVRHSMIARRLAQSLCVVVDAACLENDSCGVLPTLKTVGVASLPPAVDNQSIPFDQHKRFYKRPGTLLGLKNSFQTQLSQLQTKVDRRFANNSNVLSHVNVFYDPFDRQWKAWYTDSSFQTVFLDQI
jgi:hypothetical protein